MNGDRPGGAERACVIGVDSGSNSVRALVVRVSDGYDVASSVFAIPVGRWVYCSTRTILTSRARTPPTTS